MDLDQEIFEHLRVPSSVELFIKEGMDAHLILDLDVRSFANWVFSYYSNYGSAPSPEAIKTDWPSLTIEPEITMEPGFLVEKLKERYIKKERFSIVEKLADETDPEKFRDLLVEEGYGLWKKTASQKHILTLEDYDELIDIFIEETKDQGLGASYGFVPLDRISGGAKKGHLSILAARPKRYKTWIGLKAFVEQRKQGMAPVFFNLELSDVEIYQRLVCIVSGTSFSKMKHGTTSDYEWDRIREKMAEFADFGPGYIISPPYDKRRIDDLVLETKKLQGQSVIIDQLSYLKSRQEHKREDQSYREIVHDMKGAAVRDGIPWFCICQFNREAASLDEMADASMVGLTRAIEETCDILLGLHRTKEDLDMDRVQLGIIEARHCSSNHKWNISVDLNNQTSFLMTEEL